MNAQQLVSLAELSGGTARSLLGGHALALGSSGGRLDVVAGRVWLTRAGELDDHVVEAGQSLCIAGSGGAVIEAMDDERPALVAWQPRRPLERAADAVRAWLAPRAHAFAATALLHNGVAICADATSDSAASKGRHAADPTRGRARIAAQQARRCAPSAA